MGENLHKDHRSRVRQEFLRNGFDEHTPLHKILELLLFYCIPQRDTNDLAHQLENRYGSLSGIIEAPVEELIGFKGLTENNVVLLKLILPLIRRYQSESTTRPKRYENLDQIGDDLLKRFFGLAEERFGLLCLDGSGGFLDFSFLSNGDISSVGISTRKVMEHILKKRAAAVVMAHNHPGGIALPSTEDIAITRSLVEAFKPIHVKVIDHIIIARNDYVSLAQSREFENIFKE